MKESESRHKSDEYVLKHSEVKLRKKSVLAAVLAVCMVLTVVIPASASIIAETDNARLLADAGEFTAVDEGLITEESEAGIVIAEEPEAPAEEGPEDPTEPQIKTFTVTYDMSPFPSFTEEVEEGTFPKNVPEVSYPQAVFLGWYSPDGMTSLSPHYTPVYEDTTYRGKFDRNIRDLLTFDDVNHAAYMNGFSNGTFAPLKAMSRAEAAQVFYSLLKHKDYEVKAFSDVGANKWYAKPVGVMATLGVINGYADGNFSPNASITRAEFVKMASALDNLESTDISFTDVSESHWAYDYISSAVSKGWIDGYTEKDGSQTFRPSNPMKREEAVTIVNRILGRYPASDIKSKKNVKNFYDVFSTSWSYGQIIEATTEHTVSSTDTAAQKEEWESYAEDVKTEKSFWLIDGSDKYYVNGSTRKFVRGPTTIDGVQYQFDSSTGKAFTGWKQVNGWKRYYKHGLMMEDISKEGLVTGPYYIKVYKPWNYLIIYAKDGNNGYTIPVKAMITSCGVTTPTGTYYTPYRYRWLRMEGYTWAQWCTQIIGSYLFHSVPNWTYSNLDLEVDEYNHLGETRSMGCIRLTCEDAKWIYDNCQLGTQVFISAVETSGPLKKPTSLKLPAWHTWDPTDPTAHYMCDQRGCH